MGTDERTISLNVLKNLQHEDTLCDVVVLVNGVEFKAHKIVLCTGSSYFRTLFAGSWSTDRVVYNVPGVAPDMMKLIIHYAYTHKITVTKDNVGSLLTAADQFCDTAIVQVCCEFLETQLCPQNCIGIWKFTETCFCPELCHCAFRFILHHFEEVGHTSAEFLGLSLAQLCDVIEQDRLNVEQEDVVFHHVLRWIEHKVSERKAFISVLLPKMRTGLMSTDFILNTLKENSLVKDSVECKLLVLDLQREQNGFPDDESCSYEPASAQKRPRLHHTVLLAIGGWSGLNPTNVIESYDFRANAWVVVTGNESPQAYHGTVYLNGVVYCIGGRDGFRYFNSVRVFDPATLAWCEAAPMYYARCFVSVAALDGMVYAMGGYDGHDRLSSAERYAPETNQWSAIAPMQEQRSDAGAAVLHGKVYICGGFDGEVCHFTAEYYSPQTNQWTMIMRMNSRRSGLGVTVYAGEVFAVGGFNGASRLSSAEAYNPQTESWHAVPDMLTARSNFGIEVMDDRLFVVGGFNGFTTTFLAERYDASTGEWTSIEDMSVFRSALSCCTVPGLPNVNRYAGPRGSL